MADARSAYGREYVRALDIAAANLLKNRLASRPLKSWTRADKDAFTGGDIAPLEPYRTLERGGNRPVGVRVHGARPSTIARVG